MLHPIPGAHAVVIQVYLIETSAAASALRRPVQASSSAAASVPHRYLLAIRLVLFSFAAIQPLHLCARTSNPSFLSNSSSCSDESGAVVGCPYPDTHRNVKLSSEAAALLAADAVAAGACTVIAASMDALTPLLPPAITPSFWYVLHAFPHCTFVTSCAGTVSSYGKQRTRRTARC